MFRPICNMLKPIALVIAVATANYCLAADTPIGSDSAPARQSTALTGAAGAAAVFELLGDSNYKASHHYEDNGYTIESGPLIGVQNQEQGALIVVRASDGSLTAIVSRNGQNGLLQVSANGEERFSLEPEYDWLKEDGVPAADQEPSAKEWRAQTGSGVIDVLAGFTQAALDELQGDPRSYALAQLETVNLSLRNSKIENVHLRLAGIRVHNEDIPVTTDGLARWQQMLTPLRSRYMHDLNVAYSVGGDAGGWAYVGGETSVNLMGALGALKHEVGHNVGGRHCNLDGADNYKFGFDTGDDAVRTNLCGNSIYYYSNPEVRVGQYQIGNAITADMARLWREQVGRLVGYSPAYRGLRLVHVGDFSRLDIALPSPIARPYFVAVDPRVGPTKPEWAPGKVARLELSLRGDDGQIRPVVMQASCSSFANLKVPMNSLHGCNFSNEANLMLEYDKQDNPQLPSGWYNGTVQLKFVAPEGEQRILVSVSVKS